MSAPRLPTEQGKSAWSANASLFSPELRAVGDQLVNELDQAHLFAHWPAPGTDDDRKRKLLEQIAAVESAYLGGVATYIQRAKGLLKSAAASANPYEGFKVTPPSSDVAVTVDSAEDFARYEPKGLEQAAQTAFVIVAGGLGERLGYKGIKLALPSDISTEMTYIELYIRWILALQTRARESSGNQKLELQFAIMTSDDTDVLTRKLLAENNNFGMTPSQLTIFKQGKVPSLQDNDAHFVLDEKDPYVLDTKPHGHGDVHSLLYGQGIVERWVQPKADDETRQAVQWIVFFQDTNGLVFHGIVPALGVSAEKQLHMNTITVPRAQGDAVGAICTLEREKYLSDAELTADSLPNKLTINVEYNQLEGLMGKGVKEPLQPGTNYSQYAGNTNVLVLNAPEYFAVLQEKKGIIPEFVNPKYQANMQSFKKPTRLECMMQEWPKLLSKDMATRVGFSQFQRLQSFSAVKNAIADGVAKQKSGNAAEVAATGEQDMYQWCYELLTSPAVGAKVESGSEKEYRGIKVNFPPHIIFTPEVGVTQQELISKLPGKSDISISARSTVIVDGAGISLGKVSVDGTLIILAAPGVNVKVDGLTVKNAGWEFKPLTDAEEAQVEQKYAIRGYTLDRKEQSVYCISKPGDYVLSDETAKQYEVKNYEHPARVGKCSQAA